jgi:YfiR/HmsC-like
VTSPLRQGSQHPGEALRRYRWFGKLIVASAIGAALTDVPRVVSAEDLALPAEVEAQLIAKVATYDRTLVSRAGDKVVIAIVKHASDQDSARAASLLQAAFRDVAPISNLMHEEFVVAWKDGAALAQVCTQKKAAIVFFTPGLDRELDAMVKAVEGLHVLTIAGALAYMKKGVVLGFDLVSGRPKLVINFEMSKRQGLELRSELLRLARVVE